MRLKLIFTFLVLCGSVSLTFAQGSATFPPSGGSAAKVCVGTPGNTLGTYLSQCQSTAIPPILYICGNVAGCSVSADWTPTNGSSTVAWSGLSNPTGNLSLSMGSDTTAFNTTTALASMFSWNNTTAATSSVAQSSPVLNVCGRAWHGSADTNDCATLQYVPNGSGNDQGGTVIIGHSGGDSGTITTSLPGPVSTTSDGVHAGYISVSGNTTVPNSLPSNSFGFIGPNSASFTSYFLQPPATAPSGTQFLTAGTPSSNVSSMGLVSSTGSGSVVLATSPTLVTPALGTPASGNASNLTNLPITLTTTGTSGAASYTQSTNTLNVPQYSAGGTVTVVGSGNLTSTACVTGGGSQTIQTPSSGCTINSSGQVTDAGETVTGTSATDSAPLGSELTTSGTCSGTGWTGTYPNYIAPATTAALTCTGFTSASYYQTVTGITNNAGLLTATYSSGGSFSGTGNCSMSSFNNGGTGASATIAVSSGTPGAISGIVPGYGFTSAPTSATVSSGTATCSGTPTITSTIGGGTLTVAIGGAQTAVSTSSTTSTVTAGLKANGTSLTYTPTAAFVGTVAISAKKITAISQFPVVTQDSGGNTSIAISQQLASNHNLFISAGAGGSYDTTGTANTGVGISSLVANTTGSNNTASGYAALNANTTGINNTANGYNTLSSNTTGSANIANGSGALFSNTTGGSNTASGCQALNANTTGNYNTASGADALLFNTTGNYNTASGVDALFYNTTGGSNTASGYLVLYSCGASGVTCTQNVAEGYNAGRYYGGGTSNNMTQATAATLIGYQAESLNNNDSNETCIGNLCTGNGSNTSTFGNTSSTDAYFTGTGAGSLAILHAIHKAALNTVATLGTTCTSGQTGLQYYVTDATVPVIGSTVAGSGTAIAMVWCNGTNWTVTGK